MKPSPKALFRFSLITSKVIKQIYKDSTEFQSLSVENQKPKVRTKVAKGLSEEDCENKCLGKQNCLMWEYKKKPGWCKNRYITGSHCFILFRNVVKTFITFYGVMGTLSHSKIILELLLQNDKPQDFSEFFKPFVISEIK